MHKPRRKKTWIISFQYYWQWGKHSYPSLLVIKCFKFGGQVVGFLAFLLSCSDCKDPVFISVHISVCFNTHSSELLWRLNLFICIYIYICSFALRLDKASDSKWWLISFTLWDMVLHLSTSKNFCPSKLLLQSHKTMKLQAHSELRC